MRADGVEAEVTFTDASARTVRRVVRDVFQNRGQADRLRCAWSEPVTDKRYKAALAVVGS
ncbi:hypothetical protein [Streptomyces sp. NPDC002265]|uniref:hypothetical protein n=1 Tax=Streptomyces sp. NPDC002265 TaxID=3154415 RepID=UPI00331B494A